MLTLDSFLVPPNLYQKWAVAWAGYLFLLHTSLFSLHLYWVLSAISALLFLFSLPALRAGPDRHFGLLNWNVRDVWECHSPKLSVGCYVWLCIHFMIGKLANRTDSRGMLWRRYRLRASRCLEWLGEKGRMKDKVAKGGKMEARSTQAPLPVSIG